jgi:hypothetical protein
MRQSNLVRLGMLRVHARARAPAGSAQRSGARRGSGRGLGSRWRAPAAGSLRPQNPPSGEAKLPPISGQKSSLRTVKFIDLLVRRFPNSHSRTDGGSVPAAALCRPWVSGHTDACAHAGPLPVLACQCRPKWAVRVDGGPDFRPSKMGRSVPAQARGRLPRPAHSELRGRNLK